jgi:hypothetical protein
MRKLMKNDFLFFTLLGMMIGVIFFVGSLLYSQNFTLVGYIDAGTMSTLLLFALGWFMLVSNEGTLDILVYGVQAFAKALVGKRMKQSYFDYTTGKTRVSKGTFLGFWMSAFIWLLPTVIMVIIHYA